MKVTCQFSGVEYEVPNFPNMRLTSVHPIFHANIKQLLSRVGEWHAGKMTPNESRLLFLALLHSTELVEFRTTALPSPAVVAKNMEHLIKFIGWSSGLSFPARVLPRFAITPETSDMENVNHWLGAWEAARADFQAGYIPTSQLSKMRNREAALERLIKNSQKKVDDYSSMLGAWAMEAANVPAPLREYWMELFTLKGVAVHGAKRVDLEELVEHMLDNLDHGSIYSSKALKHVKELLERNVKGVNYALGMDDIVFVEDSIEAHNKRLIAAKAPAELPVLGAYPTKLAYLRAKAAWDVAQTLKQDQDEYNATQKDAATSPEDIFSSKEEADEAEEEDMMEDVLSRMQRNSRDGEGDRS